MEKKLRIGVLVNGNRLPLWAYTMLEKISGSAYASIELLILREEPHHTRKSPLSLVLENWNRLAYLAFTRFENRLHRPKPFAFDKKNLQELVPQVPVVRVKPKVTKWKDEITDADIETIRSYDLDVIIRLGFRILKGKILTVSRYGVWSYHHGDNRVNRGGPAGFWEIAENWDTTGVILQILNEQLDGGKVICRSLSLSHPFSLNRNLNNYYWKAAGFLPRKLQELHSNGAEAFFARIEEENQHPDFYSNRLFSSPSNAGMLKIVAGLYWRLAKKALKNLFINEQWMLYYRHDKGGAIPRTLYQFKKMLPPRDRYWSTPHILKKEDGYYIFLEEYIHKNRKGHISVSRLDEKGRYTQPQKVLDRPYHLSYPFVFSHEGTDYMIPETRGNQSIELYKCISFPDRWELVHTLMSGIEAVDSTLLKHEGKWWLFANVITNRGASSLDELFIFYADDLFSPTWTAHQANPVISDVRRARPAGRIFTYNRNLYRPSQNSSKRFGYGININHIETLNTREYRETVVSEILPNWDKKLVATHTLSSLEGLCVLDAMKRRNRFI